MTRKFTKEVLDDILAEAGARQAHNKKREELKCLLRAEGEIDALSATELANVDEDTVMLTLAELARSYGIEESYVNEVLRTCFPTPHQQLQDVIGFGARATFRVQNRAWREAEDAYLAEIKRLYLEEVPGASIGTNYLNYLLYNLPFSGCIVRRPGVIFSRIKDGRKMHLARFQTELHEGPFVYNAMRIHLRIRHPSFIPLFGKSYQEINKVFREKGMDIIEFVDYDYIIGSALERLT